jgi:dinuclear metal center YbgI/SA1388 family protein
MPVSPEKLVAYADRLLNHAALGDYPGALNGLQVEASGPVRKLAAAVDSHEGVLRAAVREGADFLIVHHGMFWDGPVPWTGVAGRKARFCFEQGLAVYSSHLPLDAHPRHGNNVLLARALGLRAVRPFYEAKGYPIGRCGTWSGSRSDLVRQVARATGTARPHVVAAGPVRPRRVGVVTGAFGDLAAAAAAGIDTVVSGEGRQAHYGTAVELGLNLILAGHYATETFGVRSLTAHLASKFRLPWTFLDVPTGF